jgi:glycosyltransferase involved in cell wall biosynthesis
MQFPATTETFASNDVLMLKKLGVDISVFSLKPKHKKHTIMIHERGLEGVNIFNCTLRNILLGFFSMLRSPLKTLDLAKWIFNNERSNIKEVIKCLLLIPSSFAVYKQIVKLRPEVVHLFWGHYPSTVGYLIYKYEPKILLSIFLGAYDLCLNLKISKFIAEKSDFIFTHSYSNIPMFLKMGLPKGKIEIIHRGVDVKKIDRAVSGVLSIEGKIITAGKLIPEKNFDLSIHFIKKLIDKGGNFYLDIIGSGPELSKLERLTKDLHLNERIKFYSHMSQQNLFVKMAESQFFIMTSSKQSERLPNVIKEAMYCGCICASFRTQGLDELMNSTVNGFIFDEINKDLEEFFLLTSEWQLNKIASNARSTISEKFQIKQSMLKYIEKWEGGSSVKSKI